MFRTCAGRNSRVFLIEFVSMFAGKQRLGAFEFFNYLYGCGCDSFVSEYWFRCSTEFEYARLVLSLTAFLLGKRIEDSDRNEISLYDLKLARNVGDKYCNLTCDSADQRFSSLFYKLEQFLRNNDSKNKTNIEDFKSFLNFQTLLKKDIDYLIYWVVMKFFKTDFDHENITSLNITIDSYLNLAYNIDHAIWDFIVSDYIFYMREKGTVRINSFNCDFNNEVESLFFLMINPYNICPTLCCILLLLKSKIKNTLISTHSGFNVKYIIKMIIGFMANTIKKMSPDMAELSFTITVCRMVTCISKEISCELIHQLLSRHSFGKKSPSSDNINSPFIERLILNSFSSIEQLKLEITRDEQLLVSIINHIPTLELAISLISLNHYNNKSADIFLLLTILFSLNNDLAITNNINKNAVEIFRMLVKKYKHPVCFTINNLLFTSKNDKIEGHESRLDNFFDLLSNNIANISISLNLIKSMVLLIQLNNPIALSDAFLYKYLDSFPKLTLVCNNKAINTNLQELSLFDFTSSYGCTIIDNLYWCNPNLIQFLLSNINIKFQHIFSFICSLSLSITNIQLNIDNNLSHSISPMYGIDSQKINLKNEQNVIDCTIYQLNTGKPLNYLLKTKNLDNIIILILDFLSDWIKKNENQRSIESIIIELYEELSSIIVCEKNKKFVNFFSIFLIYLLSRIFESDKTDRKLITFQLHTIPWRTSLRWIESWERIFTQSALNSRTWQIIFSEIIAIMAPESLIIPYIPIGSSYDEEQCLILNKTKTWREKLVLWLNRRKFLNDPSINGNMKYSNIESTRNWLEKFYLEPNMTVYFTLEAIFLQESTHINYSHFQEIFFEICSDELKLKEFVEYPEHHLKKISNYLLRNDSIEILCNISIIMLYFHEVIKHKNPIINHFQNLDYEILSIIWNKYANYYHSENMLTNKQLNIFLSNIIGRNSMVVQQIIEHGFQYKSIEEGFEFCSYLEKVQPLIYTIYQYTPQNNSEHVFLPKIANKLDKILDTNLLLELWGKYDVNNRGVLVHDFQIENQIIHCISLLSWLSNIIEPTKVTYIKSENHSSEKTIFLPVAERLIVRVLCVTQEIINSNFEERHYTNLIKNFNLFLKYSATFIASVANSFPQLNKSLKDTISVLKQLISNSLLSDSGINNTLNIILKMLQ
ncbi:hypothetical protein HWI79_1469 [Cryptosporidium felis]|nr:hypothetical protein HWI79_1469 [Cryptosporidium felis]